MRRFLIALGLALAAFASMLFIFAEQLTGKMSAAFFERGAAYDRAGNYQRAIADYNEALRINPNMKNAAKNREMALARLAETAQAQKPVTSPSPR